MVLQFVNALCGREEAATSSSSSGGGSSSNSSASSSSGLVLLGGYELLAQPRECAGLEGGKGRVLEEVLEDFEAVLVIWVVVQNQACEGDGGVADVYGGMEHGAEGEGVVVGHEVGFLARRGDEFVLLEPQADDKNGFNRGWVLKDLGLRVLAKEILEKSVVIGKDVHSRPWLVCFEDGGGEYPVGQQTNGSTG